MATVDQQQSGWKAPEYTSAVTITEFFNSIKRNKGVFWVTLLTCLALGVLASLLLPERFSAGSELLVEGVNSSGQSASPENIIAELDVQGARYPLTTQVELLQSQEVFWKALDQAGIAAPTTVEQLRQLPQVSVRQKKESNIFFVIVEGTNKKQVADLALAYPTVFQEYSDRLRNDAANRAAEFVASRLEEEKAALKTAETEFANYKVSNRVVDSSEEISFRLNSLANAESALAEARAAEQAASAAVMETKRELDRTPKVRAIVNDQSNEAILVDNKNILNNLEIRRAELLEIYLPTSKNVKEVDAQIETKKRYIAELERNLKRTIEQTNPEYDVNSRRYSDALANRDAAASRRASLEQLLNDRTGRVNNLGTLTKDQREFERRIALHAQSIQQMQDLQDRVQLRNNQIRTSVQKLTQAVFAERTMPNWPVNMAIATIVGLALAVVFSLIRDSAQDKVHTKEDAYLLTGITPLASIPERSRTKHPIITNPQSNAAFESYRVLRSNIAAQAKERSIKSITVTSTLRREGKSVVASNLAIAYVLIGQRTILVDANMRHPSLHTLFGLPDKPGLGDLLLGTATVNDVLQSTTVEGLYVVTVGTIPANATEVMGSPRMQEILNLLTDQADMVIVDAPQIVGLADAPSLAAVTDGSVIVTITGKPSKAEFKEAVGIIDAASPALLGSVYNRVSAKEAHLTKG